MSRPHPGKKACDLYREWLEAGRPEPFLEWSQTRRNEEEKSENKQ